MVDQESRVFVDPCGRCNPSNAAKVLQVSVGTLSNWRVAGEGPRHIKVRGRIYYMHDDLVKFARGEAA